jgi:hypothetical protein
MHSEAVYLSARCYLILDALERAEPGELIGQLRSVVDAAAAKGDLRGLRAVRRDVLEMCQILANEDRAALQTLLDIQEADDPIHRAG